MTKRFLQKSAWIQIGFVVLLVAIFLSITCESAQQRLAVASILVAAMGIYAVGRCVLDFLLKPQTSELKPQFFTGVLFGQMTLLVGFYAISPLLALLGNFNLAVVVAPVGIAASFLLIKRKFQRHSLSSAFLPRSLSPITVCGLGAISGVVALYSWHLTGMGMDSHFHIYWTQQVLDAGHIPLIARDTHYIDYYTRGFHTLAALWAAMGLGIEGMVGPFVKIQPFVQSFVPCAAVLELMVVWVRKRKLPIQSELFLSWIGSPLLIYFATQWTRIILPNSDLSGTPRCSVTAIAGFSVVCMIASLAFENKKLSQLAILSLPFLGTLLLATNPATIVGFAVIYACMTLLLWLFIGRVAGFSKTITFNPLLWVVSLGCAAAVLVQDPWIVSKLAGAAPKIIDPILRYLGLQTFDQAVQAKLITAAKIATYDSPVSCIKTSCLLQKLQEAVHRAPQEWLDGSKWSFPFGLSSFDEYSRKHFDIALKFVLGIGLVAWARNKTSSRELKESRNLLLYYGLTLCCLGFLNQISVLFFGSLGLDNARDIWLFGQYVYWQQELFTHLFFWILACFTLLFAASAIGSSSFSISSLSAPIRRYLDLSRDSQPSSRRVLHAALLIGLAFLPLFLLKKWESPIRVNPFAERTKLSDIKNLRDLESLIPNDELALIPAFDLVGVEEHWTVPYKQHSGALALARGPFIFNVRLGKGLGFTWKDLDNICDANPTQARDFLKQHNIKWFYAHEEGSDTAAYLNRPLFCNKKSLSDLGADPKPRFTRGGQTLYHVL